MHHPTRIGLQGLRAWLIALLAGSATAILWIGPQAVFLAAIEPVLLTGMMVAFALWLLILAKAINHARAEQERQRFELVRHRETLVEPTIDIEPVRPVRFSYAPAWTILALTLLVTLAVRFEPAALAWLVEDNSVLLGVVATALIWLVAAGGLLNYDRTRRFALVHAAAQRSTHVALEALELLPVMVSMCTPDGRRKHFNLRYREVTGKDDAELRDDGWRACVHEDDREIFDAVFNRDAPISTSALQIEYGMHDADGGNHWVRERFVPRFRADGHLVGYLAAAVDITSQIENETELAREAERLRKQIAKIRSESKQARSEYKTIAAEHESLAGEKNKLAEAVNTLEVRVAVLEASEASLQESVEEQKERVGRSKAAAVEARQMESQLRAKIKRLTTRCQDVDGQLEHALDDKARAVELSSERARELAAALRPQIDGVHELVEHLRAIASGDAELGELESAMASTASIAAFLDGVLGEVPETRVSTAETTELRPFDIRAAVQSVTKMLQPTAATRGVTVQCEIDPEFPPTVCGDSVHVREALLLLGTQALHVVEDGTLTLRLSQDGTTPEFVAARCTVAHDTLPLGAERLRELFAMHDTPAESDDPLDWTGRYQCAVAWQLVHDMKGEFGFDPPFDGGFAVWFTLNLARRAMLEDAPAPAPVQVATPTTPPVPDTHAADAAPDTPESTAETSAPPREQRSFETRRLPQELLTSNLGEVRELGPHSVRLRATKSLSGRVQLELFSSDEPILELEAEVVESEKIKRGQFDVVMRIVDVTPALHQRILTVALSHRPLTMRPIEQ